MAGDNAEFAPALAKILHVQEMNGERVVNHVRLVFVLLGFAMLFGFWDINTREANLIFAVQGLVWLGYTLGLYGWFRARGEDTYAPHLKYISITVDLTVLTLSALANGANHSGIIEYFRGFVPLTFVLFNLLAGFRYAPLACFYSAALSALLNGVVLVCAVVFDLVEISNVTAFDRAAINVGDQIIQVVYIAVPGIVAAVIARSSRALVLRAEEESLRRARLEKEKERLGKYLSKDLVELVLEDPDRLDMDGTRQVATIMFTDIRDFTPLSEGTEPERVVSLLNRYFSEMVDIVFCYGGTLDKFLGDGLMVVFGVPFEVSLAPTRAVVVALEMLEAVRKMNERLAREGIPALRIGVGIATGPVVAGNIGSHERMEYTCIGDTVNFAARIEAINRDIATSVLVSADTRAELDPRIPVRALPPIRVKGKRDEVELFVVDHAAMDEGLLRTLRFELLDGATKPIRIERREGSGGAPALIPTTTERMA